MTAAITDFTQYAELRQAADSRDPDVLREVAGQFEALFLQSMLESMRDASLGDPLFGDSDQHAMYRDMLDQQLAAEMAGGKGIGLAEMIVRQLGGEDASGMPRGAGREQVSEGDADAVTGNSGSHWYPLDPTARTRALPAKGRADPASVSGTGPRKEGWLPPYIRHEAAGHLLPEHPGSTDPVGKTGATPGGAESNAAYGWADPASFARDIWPHAQRVANRLNVAPEAVMAQAALETGWGRHVMPRADGAISNNLFGIKASADWEGESVMRRTLEFAGGIPRQEVARFRSYDDVADSFDDYAAFLSQNPRYRPVLDSGSDVEGFARAIADSGYATDPEYASKISRVANGELMHEVLAPLKNAGASSIRN